VAARAGVGVALSKDQRWRKQKTNRRGKQVGLAHFDLEVQFVMGQKSKVYIRDD